MKDGKLDVKNLRSRSIEEAESAARLMRLANALELVDLPKEAKLSWWGASAYNDNEGSISLEIHYYNEEGEEVYEKELVNAIPWADRVRPIGAILRAFHCKDISREVNDSGTVQYHGRGTVKDPRYNHDDWEVRVSISVHAGGISPACTVTTEKVTRVVTDTRVVVTCPDYVKDGLVNA